MGKPCAVAEVSQGYIMSVFWTKIYRASKNTNAKIRTCILKMRKT